MPNTHKNLIDDTTNYGDFLSTIKGAGYEFVFYSELNSPAKQVIIRHDIDFDCALAYKMALVEHNLGIKATYFFLVTSESYNLAAAENQDYVNKIMALGHSVSLHFDPTIYADFHKGFLIEKAFIESLFNIKVSVISLHRPSEFFQKFDYPIGEVEHTYLAKYFKEVKYLSDSTGIWRYGHPFDTEEFAQKKSLHILIHPIWWMVKGATNTEKLATHFTMRKQLMKDHYLAHCKPFKEVYDKL